jgi:hypothetical protein
VGGAQRHRVKPAFEIAGGCETFLKHLGGMLVPERERGPPAMTAPGLLSVDAGDVPVPRPRVDAAGWLLVQVADGAGAAVAAALSAISGVRGWHGTTGSYDFVVELAGGEPGPLATLSAVRALTGVGHVVCCRPSYGGEALVLP